MNSKVKIIARIVSGKICRFLSQNIVSKKHFFKETKSKFSGSGQPQRRQLRQETLCSRRCVIRGQFGPKLYDQISYPS